ncbi:putative endoribonuclease l-psp protein [Phaeoacremonium minimum UCRPA7]|uniref:Putative endoribonuclease l-psp protein n=1 Tax=Phaeoacremonium minimum (strain UCR-PA7) TaxID=1286976 RepID=R8BT08_PHAM7|nr:putative endoribonuclease l-psp protein [Phaeoacremonium minimum UCRPA7]EOO02405.1 putative endoribonuclease l-psp protein [Phaeoacremonium minimum UCRPA7]
MAPPIVSTINRSDIVRLATTYSDLSIVPFPPHKPVLHLLRTAGQVGTPPSPSCSPPGPVPASFREQAENAFSNLAACLKAGGATPRDITKITIFVVGLVPSLRGDLVEVITAFFSPGEGEGEEGAGAHAPPSSLIGVAALASSEFLIEVEAEAAVAVEPEA